MLAGDQAALPFALIMVLMCVALYRALRQDELALHRRELARLRALDVLVAGAGRR